MNNQVVNLTISYPNERSEFDSTHIFWSGYLNRPQTRSHSIQTFFPHFSFTHLSELERSETHD